MYEKKRLSPSRICPPTFPYEFQDRFSEVQIIKFDKVEFALFCMKWTINISF